MDKGGILRIDCGVRESVKAWAMIRNQLGKFSISHSKKIAKLEFKSRFS